MRFCCTVKPRLTTTPLLRPHLHGPNVVVLTGFHCSTVFRQDMYSGDRLRLFPVTVWCFLRKDSSRTYFQYTGVSSMVWGAASVLQDLCEDLILKNTAAWEISGNNLAPPKRIVKKICPRLCSERGRCINGTCKCRRGISLFIGINCWNSNHLNESDLAVFPVVLFIMLIILTFESG